MTLIIKAASAIHIHNVYPTHDADFKSRRSDSIGHYAGRSVGLSSLCIFKLICSLGVCFLHHPYTHRSV